MPEPRLSNSSSTALRQAACAFEVIRMAFILVVVVKTEQTARRALWKTLELGLGLGLGFRSHIHSSRSRHCRDGAETRPHLQLDQLECDVAIPIHTGPL